MASDSAPNDPIVGEVVDERWRIVDRLGSGGMGVVYRGQRVKLGKAVAVKFLDERAVSSPDAVARFDREARAISRLQHRHCVSILDFGVWRRRPYIVMEFVDGRPLNEEMGKPGMTPARGVRIMRQILEACRHAHASGVVHRDLKPENVMLTETTGTDDFVKLLDFGLARIISVDEPTITLPKIVAGTPSYMSPEQARGDRADHRTDIYSAGVILYGMCTGRKPFKSDDSFELLRMHLNAPPPSPRKVAPEKKISPALERVILRALEKDRDARFYHCDEFLAALETVPEARAPARARRRSGRLVGATVAALAVAGGGAAWLWLARLQPRELPHVASAATGQVQPAPVAADLAVAPKQEAAAKPEAAALQHEAVAAAKPEAVAPKQEAVAPPATVAAPPREPVAAPPTAVAAAPIAVAAPPAVAVASPAASTRDRVAELLAADQLADADRLLRAQAILEPRAGWVHLDLGEVYFRRIWRRDAEREWDAALTLDPSLRSDPRLAAHLCATLAPQWDGAGQRLAVKHLGATAVAPLAECARSADPARAAVAARLLDRIKRR
jgi:eukaryotic-like serine/threonine-protein kinase